MKHPPQASGLTRGLPFLIPDDWTPEQAQAVFELLDDLRERIWEHYALALHQLYRQQRLPDEATRRPFGDPAEPF